ncbi:PH domain-containing protein [Edaphobacillus lindanitolerans]|uniref:Putative membrane protein n=1 Tax=Edaphobacillus lindanitolerans TaxID=550447 RepID=A0A1U7PR22_9BACI|nr:PH domain-containing protein [Edaphobacillus lindanitolerans]SIT87245.1 putative membrane protein [Edaphobacillus lindanitolerans]
MGGTETGARRMHPAGMLLSVLSYIKNTFFIILFLFVFRAGSEAVWVIVLKIAFLALTAVSLVTLVPAWWRKTYRIEDDSVKVDSGIFVRKHRSIPFRRVQNVNRQVPAALKLLGLTSLTLETGAGGEESSIKFDAVTKTEAARIEAALDGYRSRRANAEETKPDDVQIPANVDGETTAFQDMVSSIPEKRIIHFTPSTKDIVKASFLSFSFIALIPVVATVYKNADDFFDLDGRAKGIFSALSGSSLLLVAVIAAFVLFAMVFGMVRTWLKYGKYEISSDDDRIYIRRGVFSEQALSVRKKNVQAVEIVETPLKRVLGMAEAKLITVGSFGEGLEDINSLYPYLPRKRALEIISELLPDIEVEEEMDRLPKAALAVKMMRVPWLALAGSIALFIWKPEFRFVPDWWVLAAVLFAGTWLLRLFDYRNTRYLISGPLVQFRKGGIWRTTFITKREKVIEAEVSQSRLQKVFGVASIKTVNRAKPVHHQDLDDVPAASAAEFNRWYTGRTPELIPVELEG